MCLRIRLRVRACLCESLLACLLAWWLACLSISLFVYWSVGGFVGSLAGLFGCLLVWKFASLIDCLFSWFVCFVAWLDGGWVTLFGCRLACFFLCVFVCWFARVDWLFASLVASLVAGRFGGLVALELLACLFVGRCLGGGGVNLRHKHTVHASGFYLFHQGPSVLQN